MKWPFLLYRAHLHLDEIDSQMIRHKIKWPPKQFITKLMLRNKSALDKQVNMDDRVVNKALVTLRFAFLPYM